MEKTEFEVYKTTNRVGESPEAERQKEREERSEIFLFFSGGGSHYHMFPAFADIFQIYCFLTKLTRASVLVGLIGPIY